jgi:hypothetical protein
LRHSASFPEVGEPVRIAIAVIVAVVGIAVVVGMIGRERMGFTKDTGSTHQQKPVA